VHLLIFFFLSWGRSLQGFDGIPGLFLPNLNALLRFSIFFIYIQIIFSTTILYSAYMEQLKKLESPPSSDDTKLLSLFHCPTCHHLSLSNVPGSPYQHQLIFCSAKFSNPPKIKIKQTDLQTSVFYI
jgi:hypothetical protein